MPNLLRLRNNYLIKYLLNNRTLIFLGGIALKETIDILVTLDENYLKPLEVMLTSLHINNPNHHFNIWLLHESIPNAKLLELKQFLTIYESNLIVNKVEGTLLKDSPSIKKYPKEMYFRLLCGQLLPESITKILYLDPDILIINSIEELWNLDLEGYMMAAATHAGLTNFTQSINTIRLGIDHVYFNSGIMLIDTVLARKYIHAKDIYEYIEKYEDFLILPDQDVLNHLYGAQIKEIPEEVWNYDTDQYLSYFTKSKGIHDSKWLLENTSILHFCGKPKPWNQRNLDKFSMLYMHYEQIKNRTKLLHQKSDK